MLKGLFYVIVSAFIFAPCIGLLVFSVWLASDREKGSGNDNYASQTLLTSEQPFELIEPADMQPKRAVPRIVESRIAAVHAGATLIRRPPVKVQTNTAAVHAGATLIKLPPRTLEATVPNPEPKKIAPPSLTANASTGAMTRQPEARGSNVSPKPTDPQIEQVQRGAGRPIMTRKRPNPRVARVTTEPAVSVRPIVRKRRDNGDVTAANIVSAAKTKYRRTRASDVNELRRTVGQLNDKDKRALRSRCRQILAAPEKFVRLHVEICTAASM